MLHHKTKESAIKKYSHLSSKTTDLLAALKEDDNKYSDEDITEIVEAIVVKKTDTEPQKSLLVLDGFDYENLSGESFKKYCLYVQSLQLEDRYVFEQYKVEAIKKVRFRGVKDSPIDIIGIKLVNTKPTTVTKIGVKHALIFNGRVLEIINNDTKEVEGWELIGSQLADSANKNMHYYLLKKNQN